MFSFFNGKHVTGQVKSQCINDACVYFSWNVFCGRRGVSYESVCACHRDDASSCPSCDVCDAYRACVFCVPAYENII